MNTIEIIDPHISVIADVTFETELVDRRANKNFNKFGNVLDVARQYGINYKSMNDGVLFVGNKLRMQIFAEKLHFAGVDYKELY